MQKTWTKRAQKAHRAKWVAALRSGEYRQTKNVLTNGRSFCCLGVACEISKLGHWTDGPDGGWVYEVSGDGDHETLPPPVRDWLGLDSGSGDFDGPTGWGDALTTLNDDGKTFKQIAKIIESEPDGLLA